MGDAVADKFDADAFVTLLGQLVGESKHLQNGITLAPTEDRAGRFVLDALRPHRCAHAARLQRNILKHCADACVCAP
jgi:hypothetical protein